MPRTHAHHPAAAWPPHQPLAALTDAGRTILARPGPLRAIRSPADLERLATPPDRGRIVLLAYHLGGALEPAAHAATPGGPLGYTAETETLLIHDADGDRPPQPPERQASGPPDPFAAGTLSSTPGREAYTEAVRRAIAAIAAGDVYQVNLAHRLTAPFTGSPRAFFHALLDAAQPRHAAYAELPDGSAVCSASPELFLRYDPATRRVSTRPMKGTRPIAADPDELRHAEKDRAELNMITDLMRNDLGRVCAFGSVRVDAPREIEPHASSVLQATSTVSGTLRQGLTPADLVRATFPPGSVTGAPKIRAMQLIDELEATPRGFYCGALGFQDPSGALVLNVAIRTATITPPAPDGTRELHYHAGAGIVADSDPDAEWGETLQKAEILRRVLRREG